MNPLMKIIKSFPLCTSILWQLVCSIIKHKWRLFGYLLDKLKGMVLLQNLLLLTNCTDYNHIWSDPFCLFVFTGFRLAAIPIVSKRPLNRNLTITILQSQSPEQLKSSIGPCQAGFNHVDNDVCYVSIQSKQQYGNVAFSLLWKGNNSQISLTCTLHVF